VIRGKKLGDPLQVVGGLLVIQGWGSAITEYFWHHSFGVAALIDHVVRLPWWGGPAIGMVGIPMLVLGYLASRADRVES
jgi:hypothetical protein